MKYEIINSNGEVINTIMADLSYMTTQFPDGNYRETVTEVTQVPPLPIFQEARRITQLAFLNRFTDEEAIAIDLASQGATLSAAAMRRYMSKVNAAKYIDLSTADTRAGVIALENLGLIATGRALEILDAEIQQEERA